MFDNPPAGLHLHVVLLHEDLCDGPDGHGVVDQDGLGGSVGAKDLHVDLLLAVGGGRGGGLLQLLKGQVDLLSLVRRSVLFRGEKANEDLLRASFQLSVCVHVRKFQIRSAAAQFVLFFFFQIMVECAKPLLALPVLRPVGTKAKNTGLENRQGQAGGNVSRLLLHLFSRNTRTTNVY